MLGIGCVTVGLPSVFHIFRPRDGNPYVLAFFASAFLIWARGTYWLLFQNGAEMVVKHPGLLNVSLESPTTVKILWLICLAGGLCAVIAMFTQDIPLPLGSVNRQPRLAADRRRLPLKPTLATQ